KVVGLMRTEILQRLVEDRNAMTPRGIRDIFRGLHRIRLGNFNSMHACRIWISLREYEGDHTAASTHVEYTYIVCRHPYPGAQQNRIGTYFMRAAIVSHAELPELERFWCHLSQKY